MQDESRFKSPLACYKARPRALLIDAAQPTILRKLGLTEPQWSTQVLGTETRYWRAIGGAQSLIAKAAALGQSWLKGIGSAQPLLRLRPT